MLRGHAEVWRTDLVDGIIGSLIKEEMNRGGRHPLLDAVHDVLRGGERGVLAEGAQLPPLAVDIRAQLDAHNLQGQSQPRDIDLDLDDAADRPRSRILHRLRLLDVSGYERTGGTDLRVRDDLSKVWERWHIVWSPDFDARCIESARYGPTLAEAAAARLTEAAGAIERDAGKAALLLLDAALAGLTELAGNLLGRLKDLIRTDGNFFSVTGALGHLLYLYRYDAVLETAGRGEIGALVVETYQRGLWLLEGLGQVMGQDTQLLEGLVRLRETFERCEQSLGLDRAELVQVLARIGADRAQRPLVRGGVLGARWSLGASDSEQVNSAIRQFADPKSAGRFPDRTFRPGPRASAAPARSRSRYQRPTESL